MRRSINGPDVFLMKEFGCANTMLSVLPQMDALCVDADTIIRRSSMEPAILWSLELKIV